MGEIWQDEADHRQSHRNKLGMAELSNHGFFIVSRDEEGKPEGFNNPAKFKFRDLSSAMPEPPISWFTLENFVHKIWDLEIEGRPISLFKECYQHTDVEALGWEIP